MGLRGDRIACENGGMTATLAAVSTVEETDPNLSGLAETIRTEHSAIASSAQAALLHAITAGEALLAARKQLPKGSWTQWLADECGLRYQRALYYMRLADNKELVLSKDMTLGQALAYLTGVPGPTNQNQRRPDHQRNEAKRLYAEGVPRKKIATLIGVNPSTIYGWTAGSQIEARRKRYAMLQRERMQRALKRQQDEERRKREIQLAKKAGHKSLAEAYSLLRRSAQELDRALAPEAGAEERTLINRAIYFAHQAEDAISAVLATK